MAAISHLLDQGGITSSDWFSLKLIKIIMKKMSNGISQQFKILYISTKNKVSSL